MSTGQGLLRKHFGLVVYMSKAHDIGKAWNSIGTTSLSATCSKPCLKRRFGNWPSWGRRTDSDQPTTSRFSPGKIALSACAAPGRFLSSAST